MKSRKALKTLFELQMKVKDIQENADPDVTDKLSEILKLAGAAKNIIVDNSDESQSKFKHSSSGDVFQHILQNISDTFYVTDLEGNFIFVCNSEDAIFGYSKKELLQKGNIECILGEKLYSVKKLYSKGEIKNILRSIKDKNGKLHSLIINVKRVSIAGGEILISCRDITERKKAIQALVETRVFSDNLIESMKDGFCITDIDGTHLDVNSAICRMTGYTKKELVGKKPPYPYWPEEEIENIHNAFVKIMEGKGEDMELTFRRKNEERFPVIVSPSQVKGSNNKVIANFATIKDISDIRKSEKELVEKTNFLNTIIKDAAVSMWIADSEGVAVDANKACLELYGMEKKDFVNKCCILDDEILIKHGILPKLQDVFDFGKYADYTIDFKNFEDHQILHPGFKGKVIRTIINPVFGLESKVTNAIVQSIDLTEIKEVEQELEKHKENLEELVKDRTLELQEKNQELENFNKLFVGREFRIKELKDKIKDLERKRQ